MGDLGPYVEEAIPHEVGHILVGKAVGFPARGLDINIGQDPTTGQLTIGDFATITVDPPDEDLPKIDQETRAALLLSIAGGLAGQIFAKVPVKVGRIDDDRRRFDRIKSPGSTLTLESAAKEAQSIFLRRRQKFWKLVALIRTRYIELRSNSANMKPGRYQLASFEDLEAILNQP
jgi:hypothetical protein